MLRLLTAASGTKRTSGDEALMSAVGGKADIVKGVALGPLMTLVV